MGPLLPSAGGMVGFRVSEVDPQAYASNQKAAWDATDFDSLFDRKPALNDMNPAPETNTEESPNAGAIGALSDVGSESGALLESTPTVSAMASIPSVQESATIEQDGAEFMQTQAQPLLLFAITVGAPIDPATEQPASDVVLDPRVNAQNLAGCSADSSSAPPTSRITVASDGSIAHVWIRDAGIVAGAASALGSELRVKLSWLGVALASLKINGRSVLQPAVDQSSQRSVVIDEHVWQQDQRTLKESGDGN